MENTATLPPHLKTAEMKNIFLMCLLQALASVLFSQRDIEVDPTTGRIVFQQVVELDDSLSAEVLKKRSVEYLLMRYHFDGNEIQEQGMTLFGRGRGKIAEREGQGALTSVFGIYDLDYLVRIDHKDGRCRITYTDIDATANAAGAAGNTYHASEIIEPFEHRNPKVEERNNRLREKIKLALIGQFESNMADFGHFHRYYGEGGAGSDW